MAFDFTKYHDELLFVPLGGSNEVGMNLNLYTYKGKWLMVDCGIGFADSYLPGIEIIVPDISFIMQHKENLLGLVITHAHEDHIGGVPWLWRDLGCPIYTTSFTAAFLSHKVNEMGPGPRPKVFEMEASSKVQIGPFALELIGLTHSIPEMQAIAITTDKGVIMHTGDWKFDADPMIGPVSDYAALQKFGDGKVLAMVCDSTNVFVEGESGSEGEVRKHLVDLIEKCSERVVVTTFASNLARVSSIIMAAHEAGRTIALAGRSLFRIVEAAKQSGYLKENLEFVTDREVMNLPRKDVMIICTGCQGEPRAALSRIARGEHPSIRLSPGDAVIFSSRKIPGNEMRINWINNKLIEKGIEVITERDYFIHVSGHPARGELTRMYELVRPQIAVPTHGEPRHLHEHAKLARSLGVEETVQASNGAVVWLSKGNAGVIGRVESGYVAIDGQSLIPADSEIIRTRRKMRDDGAVFASAVIGRDGELLEPVRITAPGVVDIKEDLEMVKEWAAEAGSAVEDARRKKGGDQVKEALRLSLRRMISRDLDKKPVIEIQIFRVA